jgi:ribosome-associated translation inhibitor RaiA
MTIEFNMPYGKVPEQVVMNTRNQLLKLSHINKRISRVQVLLKVEESISISDNKVCEIRLAAYGDDLRVHARTGNFKNSAETVIKQLNRLVKKQLMARQLRDSNCE